MKIEADIEANGEIIGAMVDAFRQYPTVVEKYLLKHNLVTPKDTEINRGAWYPANEWLAAYDAIAKDVGVNSLYTIGKKVHENTTLPPDVRDIRSFFGACDIFYHINHRKAGALMYDFETQTMLEGIGHYHVRMTDGEQRFTVVCDNPYPCELDRGILTGMALRFEPLARVSHDNAAECRKKGGQSCTYVVSW